jgi:DNA invertase Pin-like site-specific DNA recombinase
MWQSGEMPQVLMPIFAEGMKHINSELAFECREGTVYYFNGYLPVFMHDRNDLATFRMFSSQLVANGSSTQAEIVRAFGVPLVTVKRYCKLYRQKGTAGFFVPIKRRDGSKLTPQLIAQAQVLLDEGMPVPEAGRRLGVLPNTLHKAISAGRLRASVKKKSRQGAATPAPRANAA